MCRHTVVGNHCRVCCLSLYYIGMASYTNAFFDKRQSIWRSGLHDSAKVRVPSERHIWICYLSLVLRRGGKFNGFPMWRTIESCHWIFEKRKPLSGKAVHINRWTLEYSRGGVRDNIFGSVVLAYIYVGTTSWKASSSVTRSSYVTAFFRKSATFLEKQTARDMSHDQASWIIKKKIRQDEIA